MAEPSPYHQLDALAASFGLPPPGPALRLEHGGASFEIDILVSSGTVVGLAVQIGAGVPPVQLTRESGVDRLGKKLGIAREVQLDDPAFDAQVYIVADEVPDEEVRALLARPEARQAATALLELVDVVRLGAEGVLVKVFDGTARPAFAVERIRTVIDRMAALAAALPRGTGRTPTVETKEPYEVAQVGGGYVFTFTARWVQIGVWVWVGFLTVAWIMAALSFDAYTPVHGLERFARAVGAALLAWLPSLAVIERLVRGKASSFAAFALLALLGALALCPAGMAAFVLLNALADRSPTVVHQATIVEVERYEQEHRDDATRVHVQPFGASGGTYAFVIQGWPPAPGLTVGETYAVRVRAGALGSAYFVEE